MRLLERVPRQGDQPPAAGSELRNLSHEAGAEYEQADDDSSGCRDQNRACSDVFGPLYHGMELWGCNVAERFERRIEGLRTPDCHDGERDRQPFDTTDAEDCACGEHTDSCECVDPSIVLGPQHDADATQGVLNTAKTRGDAEAVQCAASR